mgnify:CR=1 FL=1|tara:strand:- start:170 stop:439 length:270 start_codon:yes stop_codon:yes gene_type:complete
MKGKTIRSNANISVAKIAQSVKLPLKKTTETPKKRKSLLPPKKNIIKIDPASRKLSMTNVRQKNRMIEKMNDYLLNYLLKGVKKQKTKK